MGNTMRCDDCGKFIKHDDFDNGAICRMVAPDTETTSETYETLCKKCNQKENANAN